jgi:hypothetical protein
VSDIQQLVAYNRECFCCIARLDALKLFFTW